MHADWPCVGMYFPLLQSIHVCWPTSPITLPSAHASQLVCAPVVAAMTWPGRQFLHWVFPPTSWYLPVWQSLQLVFPFNGCALPVEQSTQTTCPPVVELMILPGRHSKQMLWPTRSMYLPLLQFVHDVAPLFIWIFPTMQSTHAVTAPAFPEIRPGKHERQAAWPVALWYVPLLHSVQRVWPEVETIEIKMSTLTISNKSIFQTNQYKHGTHLGFPWSSLPHNCHRPGSGRL